MNKVQYKIRHSLSTEGGREIQNSKNMSRLYRM